MISCSHESWERNKHYTCDLYQISLLKPSDVNILPQFIGLVLGLQCSEVESHFFKKKSFMIPISVSGFITTITGMCMSMAIRFDNGFRLSEIGNLGSQSLTGPAHSSRLLDWTCYYRALLCQIYVINKDILQRSSRLCNWLYLRCLVPWINHLILACCKLDIIENAFFL